MEGNEVQDYVTGLLAHHGVKGMKWGVRRSAGTSSEPNLSKEEAKAHNTTTDHISQAIKSAKHEGHMEHIIDRAHLNGHVEGNMKVHNVSFGSKKNTINYELSLYYVTPGKPSTHTGNGGKIKRINKEVPRDPRPGMSLFDDPELFKHSDDRIENILAHHGIRGMKWGVRRSPTQLARERSAPPPSNGKPPWHSVPSPKPSSSPSSTQPHAPHKSHDQVVFEELKLKAKKGGLHSLSNEEIRVLTARAEALKKATTTFPKKKTKKQAVASFVIEDLLIKSGKKTLQSIADEQMRQLGVKKGLLPKKEEKKKTTD